jgi:glyoxylase-like metal-dependent hydrolase (beta-lactamase superfamily II)
MYSNESIELTINGTPVRVHAISTGSVAVKTKFRESKKTGMFAKLDFIFDKKFTEWLPIWVWVIEHPEGVFIIDTGENSTIQTPDYFKSSGVFANWLNKTMFKFKINRELEIDKQLLKLNIEPNEVKTVFLTHLHLDHIDGLKHFPETKIIVNRLEWEKPYGDLPKLYPHWFKPELIELNEQYECFDNACSLTIAKDLIALHTPGHTNGHMSILLKTDNCHILFAGDLCYNQKQLIANHFAGVNVNHLKAKDTYTKIKAFAKFNKTVFLPSHDIEAGKRLKELVTLNIV